MVDVKLRYSVHSHLVVLQETLDSEHKSIPDDEEVMHIFNMDKDLVEFYMDESYHKFGNTEGAENMQKILNALEYGYTMDELIIVVEEV